MAKYFSTFGIEFGFVVNANYAPYNKYFKKNFPHEYKNYRDLLRQKGLDYIVDTYADRLEYAEANGYSQLIKAEFMRQGNFINAQCDETAVEIPSPVFNTLTECRTFYDRMMAIVNKYPLVDHREDCYSGGGHIHWGLPTSWTSEFKIRFLLNLFIDVTNRPYLNWVFNEYCDTLSAENFMSQHDNCVFSSMSKLRCWLKGKTPPKENGYYSAPKLTEATFDCQKGFAIRYDDGHDCQEDHMADGNVVAGGISTIEFRFFDAKRSWKEVEDHVIFANAYLNHILDLTEKGKTLKLKVLDRRDIMAQVPKAEKLFKEMVKELKLDWSTYAYYVKTNLEPRREYGEWIREKHSND